MLRRDPVNATGVAQATIYSGVVRSIVEQGAQAGAVVIARVLRRTPASGVASAGAQVVARAAVRSADTTVAQADASPTGVVFVRSFIGDLVNGSAEAVGSVVSRLVVRSVLAAAAQAASVPRVSANLRSPGFYGAQAIGIVGGGAEAYVPFDEVALEENTFVVSFEDNVFYVR